MISVSSIGSIKEQLIDLGKYIVSEKMTWGTAGNISAKSDDRSIVITSSGTELGKLKTDDFSLCNMNGKVLNDSKKPSKELPMHLAIYKNRPEINAIIHASPFFSTLACCSNLEIKNNLFVESMYYLERVERIPYFHPGSWELANAVDEKCKKANVILMENHGVLVYDVSIKEARITLEILENTCRMLILAKNYGLEFKELSDETVSSFLYDSGYKPKRVWDNE